MGGPHWRGRAGGQWAGDRGGRGLSVSAVALRPDPSEWFAKVSAPCLACESAVSGDPTSCEIVAALRGRARVWARPVWERGLAEAVCSTSRPRYRPRRPARQPGAAQPRPAGSEMPAREWMRRCGCASEERRPPKPTPRLPIKPGVMGVVAGRSPDEGFSGDGLPEAPSTKQQQNTGVSTRLRRIIGFGATQRPTRLRKSKRP